MERALGFNLKELNFQLHWLVNHDYPASPLTESHLIRDVMKGEESKMKSQLSVRHHLGFSSVYKPLIFFFVLSARAGI